MSHVSSAVVVFVGAGIGALLRWVLALAFNPVFPPVPLGTVAANLGGGLMIGLAMAFFAAHPELAPQWRLLAVTGFLGGLTTFSTFSAEVVDLVFRHEYGWAAATGLLHLAGSLLLTALGFVLAQSAMGRS